MKKLLLMLFSLLILSNLYAKNDIFVDVERVNLKLDELLYSGLGDIAPLPDGFIIVFRRGRDCNLIVKLDKQGNIITVYDKTGNGPGEIRGLHNIGVTGTAIFASEMQSPFIHEFSHDLKFKNDYRIKGAGKLYVLGTKYIGIWCPSNFDEKAENLDTLALYDAKSFKFKKYVFRVKEVPAFFSYWGSVCRINDDTFAGVYPSEYQIRIFDGNLEFRKSLLNEIPVYIKKYVPFNRSQSVVDQNAVNWTNTWSVMHSIYYLDGMFILSYTYNKEFFLDIIDSNGKVVYPNYKEKKRFGIAFIEDNKFLWRLKVEEGDEADKYTLVKQKLILE
jgi:hypothetical protein